MSSYQNTPSSAQRNSLISACALCRHRKIKCNRKTPCSNCLKASVTCTPNTPAPARKRRYNQDLQDRLARCEALLKQYHGAGPSPASGSSQPIAPVAARFRDFAKPSPSTSGPGVDKPRIGKMIPSERGERFIESQIFATFYDELQALRQMIDTEDPEECSDLGTEGLTLENNADLAHASARTPKSVEDYHPDPVHAFQLWQIFLDRVNPLTKVIHVPTLQPYVIEATLNLNQVPMHYQALLLAVYLMGVVALTDSECNHILGMSRDQALQRFTTGTQHALHQFGFLKNYNMAALQALVLFLISLQGRYDRHAAWVLSGTIVRIAQKMGYHRDGELLQLPPFETEMRRRIWWQIVLRDTKLALVSGLNHNSLQHSSDTESPRNLNDADLFPGSAEPVPSRDGPTEMAFSLIGNRVVQFMVSENMRMGFEAALVGQSTAGEKGELGVGHALLEKYRGVARELDSNLRDYERKYCDASAGGIHKAALAIRPMISTRLQEMLLPMEEQPEWGTEILGPKDILFKIVLLHYEHTVDAYERMAEHGFLWFVKLHFQLDVFAVLTGQLGKRPTGSLSNRGWDIVEKIYCWQPELFGGSKKQYAAQAQFTLKAWESREQALAACGQSVETPPFITRLRECVPSYDSQSSTGVSAMPSSLMQTQQPVTNLDQFLGCYLDISSLDWNIWDDTASGQSTSNKSPVSAMLFGRLEPYNKNNMDGHM